MLKIRHVSLIGSALGGCLALPLLASPALANPLSGVATTGSVSIANTSNKTQIDQKSEDVVIDWSSFNIGAGQTTTFVQPNAQAIAVNRIGGNSASQILGTLDANGRIVLINGNGMLFGKGSQVNVGSLVATSTNGSDSDLLSGKFTQAGNQNAAVVNQGSIRSSQGGLVALVAPSVTNAGTVNAKFGTVAVGAANKFTVDFAGDGLVSFAVQGDVNGKASAINAGSLVGANVSLTAHAAEGVATGVVQMSGIVTAQTARNVGGTILLDAGNGSLSMTGTLNAAGQTGGGAIETSGNQVSISGSVTAGRNGQWKVDPENLTINASAATSIDNALNAGTSVTEQTTSGAASGYGTQSPGLGDIIVASPLAWNTSATLTLNSYHSIDIDAPITVQGGGGLVFVTNNGGTGGDYVFGNGASITYPGGAGLGASFTLNGTNYDLLYSMSAVQNINGNLSGDYALANPLNASSVTSWTPIGTVSAGFGGVFAGMGNAISNLTVDLPGASNVGLFGNTNAVSIIRDIALTAVSITGEYGIGALAGTNRGTITNASATGTVSANCTGCSSGSAGGGSENVGGLVGYNDGTIANAYASDVVDDPCPSCEFGSEYIGGLVGNNYNGTITNSYATGAVTGGPDTGGLVGLNTGTVGGSYAVGPVSEVGFEGNGGGLIGINQGSISNSHATGAVVGNAEDGGDGGLVGENFGTITGSYATGSIRGSAQNDGGLVGNNEAGASIADSFATGAVSGNCSDCAEGSDLGGLVGTNAGAITNAYATGAAIGGTYLGGLVGNNKNGGAITDSYATGGVFAINPGEGIVVGGLVGYSGGGTVTDGYWDTETSGLTTSAGGTGLTTFQLQNALPAGFSPSVWSRAAGLYPYLSWQFSGTPQAIAGIAYQNDGAKPLISSDGVQYVYGLVDGESVGPVSTGANGYFYFLLAPGTISASGSAILVYTNTKHGAVLESATATLKGLKVWGDTFIAPTADTTYSSASATPLQTQDASLLSEALGSNTAAQTLVDGITNFGYLATGASFTIDEPLNLSDGLYVQTMAGNAGITVADPVSLSGSGVLYFDATGNIAINDTIAAGGAVNLYSGGTLAESGSAAIKAPSLTGISSGGASLTGANDIATLDAFVNSGAGGFAFTDDAALTLAAELNAGTQNLALTTAGSGSNLVLGGDILAGGTADLVSAGTLTQTKGSITAVTLTGSSTEATKLAAGNKIANLGAFTAGTADFTLVDHESVTLMGTLQANSILLKDTGTIGESTESGVIEAQTFSGSSVGGAALSYINDIATLSTFTNTGSGGVSLIDGEKLTIDGALNAGSGNIALTTEGAGDGIGFDKAVTTGGVITLNSAGGVAQTASAVITAGTLTGEVAGAVSLNGPNKIANLGEFTNTGGNFALTNAETLTIAGTLDTGTHNQTLQVTTGNLDISGGLDGATITLGSSTGEVLGAGTITANLLNVTANTGIDLTGPNHITTIGTDQTNSGPNVINND